MNGGRGYAGQAVVSKQRCEVPQNVCLSCRVPQAEADEVWINDGSSDLHEAMVFNMCTAAGMTPPVPPPPLAAGAVQQHGSGSSTSSNGGGSDEASAVSSSGKDGSQQPPGPQAESEDVLRQRVADWAAQAQVVKLEGLSRDVWQWDLPPLPTPPPPPEPATAGDQAWQAAAATAGTQGTEASDASSAREGDGEDSSCSGGVSISGNGSADPADELKPGVRRIRISHVDANRLLTNCYMRESYYDLVSVAVQVTDRRTAW